MKLYAELPKRFIPQIIFDLVVLGWVVLWWRLGTTVNERADASRGGADKLESNANALSGHMSNAGGRLEKVPVVGDTLREPFDKAAGSATQIAHAGHDMSTGIDQLGDLLGALTTFSPVLIGLVVWSFVRMRYARKAGAASRLRKVDGGNELLAIRALADCSPVKLATISPTVATDWKAGNHEITHRLAALQLSSLGLRAKGQVQQISNTGSTGAIRLPG